MAAEQVKANHHTIGWVTFPRRKVVLLFMSSVGRRLPSLFHSCYDNSFLISDSQVTHKTARSGAVCCTANRPRDGQWLERETDTKLAIARIVEDPEDLGEVALADLRLISATTVNVVLMAVKQVVELNAQLKLILPVRAK